MADPNKPTIADLFTAMQGLRNLLVGLTPDNAAQVQQTAMMQLDELAALVRATQLAPGTYVTAGAASAMAALGLFSGVAGGIFIGRQFFSKKPELPAHKATEAEEPAATAAPIRRRRPVTKEGTP